ncbi:unnamed protein product [Psylliodes chrysocephalus]|uniref:Gag-like protein n=1 Tax=Psylliodes chrysocephalus TaxID=3402493 RepID=A0A9P0GCJ1_9CUCU|nr:unnamed protein product [Psylliodes chrysocephala]
MIKFLVDKGSPLWKHTSPPLEKEDEGGEDTDRPDNEGFEKPKKYKKFKTNFVKLLERKAALTIPLSNKYDSLSDSEPEQDQTAPPPPKIKEKATPNIPIKGNSVMSSAQTTKEAPKTNKKSVIPPIVVDGRTDNHSSLTNDLKAIVKGKYSVKYTNTTTVLFTETMEDYESLLGSIKQAQIPHHTYTSKLEKTHAFVLRGLVNVTEIEEIEEDLIASYEIKPREIYKMTTKYRPLFLVVTDPAITLDYLNKNVRVVENTRIIWELRKSTRSIIQCHRCQAWGHATSNCGRPPKCLKCAGDHLTRTCIKTRETPATCVNCMGDHPANFTQCKTYTERAARMEERRLSQAPPRKFIPAPPPAANAWNKAKTHPRREDFPALPTTSRQNSQNTQSQQPRKYP